MCGRDDLIMLVHIIDHVARSELWKSLSILLRGDLSGYWSRRIDEVNRLAYRVNDAELVIIACRFHYDAY